MRYGLVITVGLAALAVGVAARQAERVDGAVIARIIAEAQRSTQTRAMFDHLVDVIGPRLSGSTGYAQASEWARDQLAQFGLSNARLEPFEFGRGWELTKFTIEMVEPRYMPIVGYPEGWSPSTPEDVLADVVVVAGRTAEEVAEMKGSLKGAAILQAPPVENFIRGDRPQPTEVPEVVPPTDPAATGRGARAGAGGERGRGGNRGGNRGRGAEPGGTPSVAETIQTSGAAVLLRPSRGEHGTLFVQAGRPAQAESGPPRVVIIGEHYNLISRLAEKGITVRLRVNVQGRLLPETTTHNVLAEIPGVDPKLRDEIVMLGAHLDSWHIAAGATDNADGVVAVMEAFRILKTIGVQPRRTLRLALWGGEEQGLLGSAAYVRQHLAGDANAAARDKLAVYFNIDPGKGPIYGWFMENNAAARPIFDAWLAPFKDHGARRNVPQGIGNTDHLSFTRNGMLGFNPIQSYVDYDEREHHTNVDTAERIQNDDLKQAAMILASFVYHAAMRPARIPAK